MAKTSSAREDMLFAASELIRARGYEGVGVAEILQRANAPRGSLYFHFPAGKEQIGAEVVERVGRETAARFRELHESGVDMPTFIERVFKTTAKESKDRNFKASCPMAAIAAEFGSEDNRLAQAVKEVFASWEREISEAARARGMSAKNADLFASAMLAAMEGAFVVAKAQTSTAPHINASHAMKALAAALLAAD